MSRVNYNVTRYPGEISNTNHYNPVIRYLYCIALFINSINSHSMPQLTFTVRGLISINYMKEVDGLDEKEL